MADYRETLYRHYVHGRKHSLAPETVHGFKPRERYLNRLIHEHFPENRNASILELGCGHGALVYFARLKGYSSITGCDRSPQQVAEARRLGIEGIFEGDAIPIMRSMGDESLDAVIAFDLIEHLTKEELIGFAAAIRRVLRRGGRWIIHVPNGESPFVGRIRYGDFTHEQAFTRESLSQLLFAIGFSQVDCHEDSPIPSGARGVLRWAIWKVIRGMLRLYLAAETGSGGKENIFTQNLLVVAVK